MPAALAAYDATFGTPVCAEPTQGCETGALVHGRALIIDGEEPNFSNTLDGCNDGATGAYGSYESNDWIRIASVDGGVLTAGTVARVTIRAVAFNANNYFDLYYTDDAQNPVWQYAGTAQAAGAGINTLSLDYTIPAGADLQAVRVQWRYLDSGSSPCQSGRYNDRDDLVFGVAGAE